MSSIHTSVHAYMRICAFGNGNGNAQQTCCCTCTHRLAACGAGTARLALPRSVLPMPTRIFNRGRPVLHLPTCRRLRHLLVAHQHMAAHIVIQRSIPRSSIKNTALPTHADSSPGVSARENTHTR